jgi:hypothetical protein
MKRLLRWLGIGIAGMIAAAILFLSSGYLLPAEMTLDLEQTLDAPPEAVFACSPPTMAWSNGGVRPPWTWARTYS